MPVYTSECKECGTRYTESRTIADYNKYPPCETCHQPTVAVILGAPCGFISMKFEPFKSSVDGTLIRNGRDLKAHNERNNVQNLHDGYDEATILAGTMHQKAAEPTKEETLKDAVEAYHEVSHGYKPTIGAQDE